MLGNITGLNSLLISIYIFYIVLVVSRLFLMLLVSALIILQLLVTSWLSLHLLALCLSSLLRNLLRKWLTLSVWLDIKPQTFALLRILGCLLCLDCNPLALNSW